MSPDGLIQRHAGYNTPDSEVTVELRVRASGLGTGSGLGVQGQGRLGLGVGLSGGPVRHTIRNGGVEGRGKPHGGPCSPHKSVASHAVAVVVRVEYYKNGRAIMMHLVSLPLLGLGLGSGTASMRIVLWSQVPVASRVNPDLAN